MKWVELRCPKGHTDFIPEDLNWMQPGDQKDDGIYWNGKDSIFADRDRNSPHYGSKDREEGKLVYCGPCGAAFNPEGGYIIEEKPDWDFYWEKKNEVVVHEVG